MKPPSNDADRPNPGAPKPGGTPLQAGRPGIFQPPQGRPPEPRPAGLDAKPAPGKPEPIKTEPGKSEPATPIVGAPPSAPASPPAGLDARRADPPISVSPRVEPGRPAQPAAAPPGPARSDAKPVDAKPAGAPTSEPPKPAGAPVEAAKPGSGPDAPKAAGAPAQAGPRPGVAVTDGPIIDLKAKRVGDEAQRDAKGDASGDGRSDAKAAAADAGARLAAGSGSAPPRVAPVAAKGSRGPGLGSVAAAGLLGGVIGAGLLFSVERAGVLGDAGGDARIDALDQRISGQFSGLDQRMATLSPRDAVAALDRRIAASEAALKPLPEAVKAAEAAAKQALDKAGAAPAAAADAQTASPGTAGALPADLAARLDGLDQRLAALQEEPGREPPAESRLGVTQAGDGGRPFAALDERVKALESKGLESRGSDAKAVGGSLQPADLAPKLATLEGEIAARTRAGAEADQAIGRRLDALQKTLDERVKAVAEVVQAATQATREAADAGKTQAEAATKALDRRLQEQSERIALLDKAVASRAEASTVQAALKVVTADRVAGALEAGVPYAEPLATLRGLETGDASRIDALAPFAETGAPTAGQLAAAFRPIGDRIAAARRTAEARDVAANGDLKRRFLSIADAIVQVRKVDAPAPAEAAEADPAAKVQAALDRGALREASQAYAAMPQEAKAQAEAFGATLKARVQAAQAAQALLSDAFKGLPTTAPATIR
ncbi:translation initiation factor 2 [uncultured Methylobacterium sp.]|uniref:translation initiation factor 2 n=1 Tax=uncultured Methylobacterium sp. TaxID=157278 RepID=UPI0035C94CA4